MEHSQRFISRQERMTETLFWPLWWITLALQVCDAASIALAGKLGAAEANGVVLRLEARYDLAASPAQ